MKKSKVILGLVVATLVIPGGGFASVYIADENNQTTLSEHVAGDAYIAGNSVLVDQTVEDDIFAAGNQVTIKTNGGADVFAAGSIVSIDGEFQDDLMLAGNSLSVSATAEDIFAAGNKLIISDDTRSNGDVFLGGGTVKLGGFHTGTVRIYGDEVIIKENTSIEGDLFTYGSGEPEIQQNVNVAGEIKHVTTKDKPMHDPRLSIGNWVRSVLSWFILALVIIYIAREKVNDVINVGIDRSGSSLGVGLLWLLCLIPASLILAITIVGLPIAIILLLSSISAIIIASAIAMIIVGVWITRSVFKKTVDRISWQHLLLGVVVFKAIQVIPVLGWLISIVITILALGALGLVGWKLIRASKSNPVKA